VSLIAVSHFEAVTLARQARLGDRPVTVIRNGGALPLPRAGTAVVPGRIVSSGRLERYKGHHRVIEALPHVMRQVPEAHLLILGSGPYEAHLHRLARQLGVGDRVSIRHIAPADRQEMATMLAESSVVAALSDYEAHPVAVMEALCAARPVVGYDGAGLGELAAAGWMRGVPHGAPAATVAQELVKAMSAPSPVDHAQLPDWDTCADQLGQVYLAALGIGPHGGAPRTLGTAGPARRDGMGEAD
jgi:glycosyltransferase involved in cell wall biosynthesis